MSGRINDEKISDLLTASVHQGERREDRYETSILIIVSGVDTRGEAFHEQTLTLNVSTWGCAFRISAELKIDDIVAVQPGPFEPGELAAGKQSFFQVRHVQREGERWIVGAWRVDSASPWDEDLEEIVKTAEGAQQQIGHEALPGFGAPQRKDKVQ